MAKERLSKLQKWILKNCYCIKDNGVYTAMRKTDIFSFYKTTYNLGNYIFPIYKNLKKHFPLKEYNKINSTISRSIRGLRDKNYIKLLGHTGKQNIFNLEAIMEDKGNCETQEEYMAKNKDKSLMEIFNGYKKWIKKSEDNAIEIQDKNCPFKTKIIMLTEKGIEKAKELLKLSS